MPPCKSCKVIIPPGDKHNKCVLHRKCTADAPCTFDKGKSQEYWDNITARRLQLKSARRSERNAAKMPPLGLIGKSKKAEKDGRSESETSTTSEPSKSKKANDRTPNIDMPK
jgi:hypothetical protein